MKGICVRFVLVLTLCTVPVWGQAVLPEPGVEVQFDEIFSPIGAGGLEYSAKLQGLRGRRVSIRGYMVAREAAPSGTFLLAPAPVQLHETEYGLADDLPPATVFVEAPAWRGQTVPHRPGLLKVTGVLDLGNREERDGRISSIRLVLDGPDSDPINNPLEINEIKKEDTP